MESLGLEWRASQVLDPVDRLLVFLGWWFIVFPRCKLVLTIRAQ
jgi:hypothetical protein